MNTCFTLEVVKCYNLGNDFKQSKILNEKRKLVDFKIYWKTLSDKMKSKGRGRSAYEKWGRRNSSRIA